MGIPRTGWVLPLTVGREEDLHALTKILQDRDPAGAGVSVLVEGNYGAGKSHYLGVIEELAFSLGLAVARVTVDARGGVRFNRMDQVAGAIFRSIQLEPNGPRGVANLFDRVAAIDEDKVDSNRLRLVRALRDGGRWRWHVAQRDGGFEAPGVHLALRAWCHCDDVDLRETVVTWLNLPDDAMVNKRTVAQKLIYKLPYGLEHRGINETVRNGVTFFRVYGYKQCWDAISDLDLLANMVGCSGLVCLFDEVEDFVQNIRNRGHEAAALDNLFYFFNGGTSASAYFAVTPEFSFKCRERLAGGFSDYGAEDFEGLPLFQPAALSGSDFLELAQRIRAIHGVAYEWDVMNDFPDSDLETVVNQFVGDDAGERNRSFVKAMVDRLNDRLGH